MKIISRKEALALGLKRYFTGKPCKWGHLCERYLARDCVCCASIRDSDHANKLQRKRRRNTDRYRRVAQEYRARNREKIRLKKRENYERNKAHILQLQHEARGRSLEHTRARERRLKAKKAAAYRALKELGVEV